MPGPGIAGAEPDFDSGERQRTSNLESSGLQVAPVHLPSEDISREQDRQRC